MLTEQLKLQIVREAEAGANQPTDETAGINYNAGYRSGYLRAGNKYAEKAQQAEERAERAEKALKQIRDWQLPETGRFWDNGTSFDPMSYEACYGSNGVRDYFKALAASALTPKTSEDEKP